MQAAINIDVLYSSGRRRSSMATNTGKGFRQGSVDARTQSKNLKTDNWTKRDTDTGRFVDQKKDGQPFKGVAKEKDGRRQ